MDLLLLYNFFFNIEVNCFLFACFLNITEAMKPYGNSPFVEALLVSEAAFVRKGMMHVLLLSDSDCKKYQ